MNQALLEDILFRYRHPLYQGAIKDAVRLTDTYPSCGDSITLYIKIQAGHIAQASYIGNTCTIATYGAELLIDHLIGQSLAETKVITATKLLPATSPILLNPTRRQCFETALRALAKLPASVTI